TTSGFPASRLGLSSPLPTWDNTTAFSDQQFVNYDGDSYISVINSNVGNQLDLTSVWIASTSPPGGTPAWISGTTYGYGAGVQFGGVLYSSAIAGNTGNQPDTHSAWVVDR